MRYVTHNCSQYANDSVTINRERAADAAQSLQTTNTVYHTDENNTREGGNRDDGHSPADTAGKL